MEIYWLQRSEADVPAADDWLHAAEITRLDALSVSKRRVDWRLGRWTAKCAATAYLHRSLAHQWLAGIEIRPAASGAPELFIHGEPAPLMISLSHRDGLAMCAVTRPGVAIGCDVELIEPRSDTFLADYFTATEQRLLARAPAAERFRLAALLWSAKESALKALRAGLRLDTRSVEVSPALDSVANHDGWRDLEIGCAGSEGFHGWWRNDGDRIATVVTNAAPNAVTLRQLV